MNLVQRILKNISVLFVAEVVGRIMSFILVVSIAKYLGDTGLGKYSFVLSFFTLFYVLFDLGVWDFTQRELPRKLHFLEKYENNLLGLQLVLSSTIFVIFSFVLFLLKIDYEMKLSFFFCLLFFIFSAFADAVRTVFKSTERMEYDSLDRSLERVLSAVFGLGLLLAGYGLVALFIVLAASRLIVLIISLLIMWKKFFKMRLSFDFKLWKTFILSGFSFFLLAIFTNLYSEIGVIMLTYIASFEAVGWYNAAYKLVQTLSFLPLLVMMAFFPMMTRSFVTSKKMLLRVYYLIFKYLFLFILPIAVGTTLLGHRIISLLYPPEFFNAGITLQLLIWVAVFVYLNIVLKTVLVSINEQKKLTMTIFFGAILSVLLNFILIPSYSFMGASIAAITTEFATFIVCFLIVSRKLGMISIGFVFGVIVSAAIMGLFVWKLYLLNLLLLIALAALLYFVFLLVFRIIKKEEVNLVLHNLNIKLVK